MVACGQHHHAAVATVDDAVVGYGRWVRTNPSTPRADMAVAVDEAFEHRGIGTALLTHLRREARRRGIERLEIRVARTPEMVRELARRPLATKGRFDEQDIVIGLKTRDSLPGQEHDAMKWAARGETHLVGAVVGNVRTDPDEPGPGA
jgi:GNAT superfamily N-acetyltransferase